MSGENIVAPGPPNTPAANLMRHMLDQVLDLGILDTGNVRRSVRDMLSGPQQVDLDDPDAVELHVRPLRDLVVELHKHLDGITRVAEEARREAGG